MNKYLFKMFEEFNGELTIFNNSDMIVKYLVKEDYETNPNCENLKRIRNLSIKKYFVILQKMNINQSLRGCREKMQKIALDLDGVVFDTETLYRVYTEIYDIDTLKKDNLKNNSKRIFQKRYNWPMNHFENFYKDYAHQILSTANIMTGIEIVLPKLISKFEFIIVTSRSDSEIALAKEKLNNIGLENVKIFNNEHQKINRFLEEKVDYIIDDDEDICKNSSKMKINALYFKNAAQETIKETAYLKTVNNWGEIYKYLTIKGGKDEN